MTLVNAYRISTIPRVKRQSPQVSHAKFQEALYKARTIQGHHKYEQETQPKLGLEDEHGGIWGDKRQYC